MTFTVSYRTCHIASKGYSCCSKYLRIDRQFVTLNSPGGSTMQWNVGQGLLSDVTCFILHLNIVHKTETVLDSLLGMKPQICPDEAQMMSVYCIQLTWLKSSIDQTYSLTRLLDMLSLEKLWLRSQKRKNTSLLLSFYRRQSTSHIGVFLLPKWLRRL